MHMRSRMKSALSIILALVLMLSSMGITVFAEDFTSTPTDLSDEVILSVDDEAPMEEVELFPGDESADEIIVVTDEQEDLFTDGSGDEDQQEEVLAGGDISGDGSQEDAFADEDLLMNGLFAEEALPAEEEIALEDSGTAGEITSPQESVMLMGTAMDDTEIPLVTVTLKSGTGTGSDVVFTSHDSGRYDAAHHNIYTVGEHGKFFYDENGVFRLLLPECPDHFSEPNGRSFLWWRVNDYDDMNASQALDVSQRTEVSLTAFWLKRTFIAATPDSIGDWVGIITDAWETQQLTYRVEFKEGKYEAGYRLESVTVDKQNGDSELITSNKNGIPFTSEDSISGNGYDISVTIPAANVTLTATWTKLPDHTVSFEYEGSGTAVATPDTGVFGTSVLLTAVPDETALFKEWQVVSGDVIIADNQFTIGNTDVVIKAVFEARPLVTVHFDAGEGTVSTPDVTTGTNGKIADLPVPVSEGWTFDGWYTAITGGDKITTDTVFEQETTVYAHWYQGSNYNLISPESVTIIPNTEWTEIEFSISELKLGQNINGYTPQNLRVAFSQGILTNQEDATATIQCKIAKASTAQNPYTSTYYGISSTGSYKVYTYISKDQWDNAVPGTYSGLLTCSVLYYYGSTGPIITEDLETRTIPISVTIPESTTSYTVTYKVVNGTWPDGTTSDKMETVASGFSPVSVPTGMIASDGFTGGAWDVEPADAAITGDTTFTYTFETIPETSYTVTLDPGEGTGDPITFRSADQTEFPVGWKNAGNCQFFYTDDGNMAFYLEYDYCPFTAPSNKLFDKWEDTYSDTVILTSAETTITAKWKTDPDTLLDAGYILSPASYTITDSGYTDISCTLTALVLGKTTDNYGNSVVAKSISFYMNGGTLTDGNGNSISFLVDNNWHWGSETRKKVDRAFSAQGDTFVMAVYISPDDYAAAVPGTYTGTLNYDTEWEWYTESHTAGPSGSLTLTLTIPDTGEEFYDIKVSSGGNGTASSDRTKAKAGTEVTLTATPDAGYVFKEWQVISGGVTIADNRFIMPASAVEVRPVFEGVTITFDAQGGSVSPASAETVGGKLTSLPTPVRSGWSFGGWYIEADGGSEVTSDTVFTSSCTIYAHWYQEVIVTFDAQGGTVTPASIVTDHRRIKDLPTPATPDDGIFIGWYTDAAGGDLVTADTKFYSDSTIYARWGSTYTLALPTNVVITPNTEFTAATVNVTRLFLGRESNGKKPMYIRLVFNPVTLVNQEDNSKTIPFKLHTYITTTGPGTNQPLSWSEAGNPKSLYIYIPAEDWSAAAPGAYQGTMSYVVRWFYEDKKWSGDIEYGSIPVTVTIPEPVIEHTVTYKIVNGTWADGAKTDRTETVTDSDSPSNVPTGMVADPGYTGGAWDVDPVSATITADTTFTYTYQEKSAINPAVSIEDWTYGDDPEKPSVTGNAGNGAVTYTYAKQGGTEFSADVPTKAGSYTVKAAIAETDDYLGSEATANFTIRHKIEEVTEVPETCETEGTKKCYKDEEGTLYSDAEGTTITTVDELKISALGHDWEAPTYTWSDDNSSVTAKRVCENDPAHVETETVDATSSVSKAGTCEARGETTYTAAFTNTAFAEQTKTVENIDALGHDWGEWVATKEATESEEGSEARTCKNDASHTETRSIPKKDHVHSLSTAEAIAATCTEDGNIKYYVCDKGDDPCGRYFSDPAGTTEINLEDTVVKATGHNYGDWTETQAPSCTEKGQEERVCSHNASHKDTRDVDATGHDWGEWKVTKAATETEEGVETRTCKNDASHTETRSIPKTAPTSSDEKISYRNTEGNGVQWTKGSGKEMEFVFKRSENDSVTFSHFIGIQADGKDVDKADYTAEPGSVIVKLKAAYLDTLSVGEHTLTALFDDGDSANANFTILAAENADKKAENENNKNADKNPSNNENTTSPQTGDNSNVLLWLAMMLVSAIVLSWILAACRKREKR